MVYEFPKTKSHLCFIGEVFASLLLHFHFDVQVTRSYQSYNVWQITSALAPFIWSAFTKGGNLEAVCAPSLLVNVLIGLSLSFSSLCWEERGPSDDC